MWTRVVGALLMAGCAMAQTPALSSTQTMKDQGAAAATAGESSSVTVAPAGALAKLLTIPSGTKVPLALKQAISTRNAKEGDPVYCETTFPFVVDDRIVIPAGIYVQGKISRVQRPGRLKGGAELLMLFPSMISPGGYTVMLLGPLD